MTPLGPNSVHKAHLIAEVFGDPIEPGNIATAYRRTNLSGMKIVEKQVLTALKACEVVNLSVSVDYPPTFITPDYRTLLPGAANSIGRSFAILARSAGSGRSWSGWSGARWLRLRWGRCRL